MRRGFTLLEVLLATIILGLGLAAILLSMSQAQTMMLASTRYEACQEVFDLGEMAYPLSDVTDPKDLDVQETKATELWEMISEERLSNAQEDKFHGYTWERECLNLNDNQEDIDRLGGLYIVKVTVKWGDYHIGEGEEESYTTFWRKNE